MTFDFFGWPMVRIFLFLGLSKLKKGNLYPFDEIVDLLFLNSSRSHYLFFFQFARAKKRIYLKKIVN